MYVYTYIYIYICIYRCINTYTCVYIIIYICIHTYGLMHLYSVYMYIYIYIYTRGLVEGRVALAREPLVEEEAVLEVGPAVIMIIIRRMIRMIIIG